MYKVRLSGSQCILGGPGKVNVRRPVWVAFIIGCSERLFIDAAVVLLNIFIQFLSCCHNLSPSMASDFESVTRPSSDFPSFGFVGFLFFSANWFLSGSLLVFLDCHLELCRKLWVSDASSNPVFQLSIMCKTSLPISMNPCLSATCNTDRGFLAIELDCRATFPVCCYIATCSFLPSSLFCFSVSAAIHGTFCYTL